MYLPNLNHLVLFLHLLLNIIFLFRLKVLIEVCLKIGLLLEFHSKLPLSYTTYHLVWIKSTLSIASKINYLSQQDFNIYKLDKLNILNIIHNSFLLLYKYFLMVSKVFPFYCATFLTINLYYDFVCNLIVLYGIAYSP